MGTALLSIGLKVADSRVSRVKFTKKETEPS